MEIKELLKCSPGELTDMGICPTCFNREHNGLLYGDNKDKMLYEDEDIECFLVGNPRSEGHMAISTIQHYHVQLIPRYSFEKRGSGNFVKPRKEYVHDAEKVSRIRRMITKEIIL